MANLTRKAWPKRDEWLIERIDRLLLAAHRVPTRRKNFFGTVAWFLESNDLLFAVPVVKGVIFGLGVDAPADLASSGVQSHLPAGGKTLQQRLLDQGMAELVAVPLPRQLFYNVSAQSLVNQFQQLIFCRFITEHSK